MESRTQRLVDLLVDGQIDKVVYDDQREKVGTALDKAKVVQSEVLISAGKVDCLLDFAEWMLERAAGIWNSASLPNKLRIQEAFFPQSLTVTKEGFGTPFFQTVPAHSHRGNWYGVPKGIRTPVIAVKGRCPRPG